MHRLAATILAIPLLAAAPPLAAADDSTTPPKTPARPGTGQPADGGKGSGGGKSDSKDSKGATPRKPAPGSEFPADWFFGDSSQRAAQNGLVGKPAPTLHVKDWRGEAQDLAKLKGKVVVVDFFATWCGPCMRAVPENVELVKKHGKDGLVFVGIHDNKSGVDALDAAIKSKGINYPVAVDDAAKSQHAFRLAFWPTYAVIDRKGLVRAVGLQPQHVATVVEKLLAEPAEGAKDASKKDAPKDGAKGTAKDGKDGKDGSKDPAKDPAKDPTKDDSKK
ncbi:MAG: TlpA disulfide reductase family protein [Phycisphaerales bacterium]|jgi:thiol-disulfide isomerase/thioredoxin